MQVRDVILYFVLKNKGDWEKTFDSIKGLDFVDEEEFELLRKDMKCDYITILDDIYPEYLKHITKPPYVLFYYGDISLLNKRNRLAVVGSREASDYAIKATKEILSGLNNDSLVIVSGMAKGIDGVAHNIALVNDIPTIAVLGTGIDNCYPKENYELYESIKKKGLVISEYPNRETVKKESFAFRNRIITGISDYVFVPEVYDRSGSLVSIRYALSQDKDIFTIPYPIFDESLSNKLIQEGAKLILTSEDINEEFK